MAKNPGLGLPHGHDERAGTARCYNRNMGMRRNTSVLAAWAALLAILMAVMAPTLAHAVATPGGARTITVEVCSATGIAMTHQMALDDGGDVPATVHGSFEHCPFCQTGASPVVLPSSSFQLPLALGAEAYPPLFYDAATPLFAWTAAQPRGPPAA